MAKTVTPAKKIKKYSKDRREQCFTFLTSPHAAQNYLSKPQTWKPSTVPVICRSDVLRLELACSWRDPALRILSAAESFSPGGESTLQSALRHVRIAEFHGSCELGYTSMRMSA